MAIRQDLTQAQQDVVHTFMSDMSTLMLRFASNLREAGLPYFDGVDTIENAALGTAERGAARTLNELALL